MKTKLLTKKEVVARLRQKNKNITVRAAREIAYLLAVQHAGEILMGLLASGEIKRGPDSPEKVHTYVQNFKRG